MPKCECHGLYHPVLPPGGWLTNIGNWHRVRISVPFNDNEEIGCGRDPADAVVEAWRTWKVWAERILEVRCFWCNDEPDWGWEHPEGEAPPCPVCGRECEQSEE